MGKYKRFKRYYTLIQHQRLTLTKCFVRKLPYPKKHQAYAKTTRYVSLLIT